MKKIILVIVLFFSLFSFGQTSNDKVIYLDSLGIETDSIHFYTKRVIEDFNLEKETYSIKEYNSQNILLVSKQVKNKKYLTLNGEYIEFYLNGNKKKKLQYENYHEVGEAKAWYSNGNLEFEGNYKLVDKNSELYVKNFWDENGVQKVTNGEGVFVEIDRETKKDTIKVIGAIVNGKKDGIWKNLNIGYPIIEDLYKNGELISGKTTHSENETYTYKEVNIHAEPNEGMNGFRKKIATNLRFSDSNSLSVNTIVGFDVSVSGTIENIRMLKETKSNISEPIINLIKKETNWNPSKYRGKSTVSFYRLPISIQIN